ncbi:MULTISPECIES: hypothetical protein [unclassified Psychrobacillus]|uniref:hypothetical protein n=1 Tax=unclassified Psychrobacillus TaxID=2636677 RepID=UPI0030F5B381
MKRLQGAEYHAKKDELIPIAYSKTKAGNICLYYKGGFTHYLNDHEKSTFQPNGLKER